MMLEHWLKPYIDPGPYEYYKLGDFPLATGYTLPDAKIAYRTSGDLKFRKSRVILFPHQFTGTTESMEFFTHPGRPLDPTEFFTIFPGAFSHGESSSPSNTPPPFNQGAFPPITYVDDVRAQYELVTKHFGIKELYAVLGWSGGGVQAYEWAVSHPELVKRAAVFSGFAKAPVSSLIINNIFQDAIRSDPAWNSGFYSHRETVQLGLRRLAHANPLVSVTSEFYRQEIWRKVGYNSAKDFIVRTWERQFLALDPNDLLSQLDKWSRVDLSVHANGDLAAALGKIKAKTFVIPFTSDRLITREDCEADAALIPNAQLRPIDSVWGHITMLSPMEEDKEKIDQVLREVLA